MWLAYLNNEITKVNIGIEFNVVENFSRFFMVGITKVKMIK